MEANGERDVYAPLRLKMKKSRKGTMEAEGGKRKEELHIEAVGERKRRLHGG